VAMSPSGGAGARRDTIMSTSSGATKSGEESARLAALVVYLSGAQRGRSVRIEDATLYLAREDGRPLTPEEACESPEMATVRRTAAGYELVAPRRQVVWVNGEPADVRILESGDLIEFDNGPVLRFQLTASEESDAKGRRCRSSATPMQRPARLRNRLESQNGEPTLKSRLRRGIKRKPVPFPSASGSGIRP